jgi:hypothetical protein
MTLLDIHFVTLLDIKNSAQYSFKMLGQTQDVLTNMVCHFDFARHTLCST